MAKGITDHERSRRSSVTGTVAPYQCPSQTEDYRSLEDGPRSGTQLLVITAGEEAVSWKAMRGDIIVVR